jgi:hypothetical protein
VEGKRYGFGVNMWADGTCFKGIWIDQDINGFGCYKWPKKKEFTGDWLNKKICGFGVQTWTDGRRYEGFFARDRRQGYGIYTSPDPNSDQLITYSGSWLNGKQHGYGCTYNSTGQVKYGVWKDGERILKLSSSQATAIQENTLDIRGLL